MRSSERRRENHASTSEDIRDRSRGDAQEGAVRQLIGGAIWRSRRNAAGSRDVVAARARRTEHRGCGLLRIRPFAAGSLLGRCDARLGDSSTSHARASAEHHAQPARREQRRQAEDEDHQTAELHGKDTNSSAERASIRSFYARLRRAVRSDRQIRPRSGRRPVTYLVQSSPDATSGSRTRTPRRTHGTQATTPRRTDHPQAP